MDLIHTLEVLFLALISNCKSGWSVRTWQTNINYNNSRNWDVGRLPCETDRVVLRESESIVLQLPEGQNVMRELVLPSNTELVLPKDGFVQFSGKTNSPQCDGQDVTFKPVKPLRWVDPHNWDGWNSATPDIERVPCVSDPVRFPTGSTYKVTVPDYVKIGSLEVNGVQMNTMEYNYAEDTLGESKPFQTADGNAGNLVVTGYTCGTAQWCECGNGYLRAQICTELLCVTPLCQQPIYPDGFCCPLCGVYFTIGSSSVNKQQFTDHVNSFLKNKGVSWHASKVGEHIQVVLVEDEEYTELLTDVAMALKSSLARSGFGWAAKEFHTSGHVWYPVSFGQVIGNFFSLMIVAALTLAGIIVFYSRNWTWQHFSPIEGRSFMFARFENQSGEVVMTSEEAQPPQTFDNPMYDAARKDEGNFAVETHVYTEIDDSLDTEAAENLIDKSE